MLAWFVRELGPHWWRILIATAAMCISSFSSVYIPYLLGKKIIEQAIENQHYELLTPYMLELIALFFIVNFFTAVRMNIMHQLGQALGQLDELVQALCAGVVVQTARARHAHY